MLKAAEKVFKALADKNRLRILKMLQRKPMCVCEIREVLGLAQPTVSKHLKILKDAGIIEDWQDGLWTNYQLKPQNIYAKKIAASMEGWLNEDGCITQDLTAAKKASRLKLYCCRKREK
ncbi:MAG: metalloregulator ArsR/SmtB family transcription factor [bacterium]|nr:metalloregulator ArsR/SmtB family transcription factor [bacterium]MDD5756617.1 metalloregulator ArsR/SmtB family transcription factor [bacterium]